MTSLTFYGGVDEIGGNKILLEDRGTKVFLDFGMQMGKVNEYFAEFVQPRKLAGMGDLFKFDLLPRVPGIYRRDYAKHMSAVDWKPIKDTNGTPNHGSITEDDWKAEDGIQGVILTHAHVDHCAYIHYLRPEIPIYCTEASRLIMQGFQDMGGGEEYITYKENFRLYKGRSGGMSRANKSDNREEIPRNIQTIKNGKKFSIDSIEFDPISIDHSLPGVCGFIIHTSSGTIGYTGDIRFHGRRREESEAFVDRCGQQRPDCLLCEGTRINVPSSKLDEEGVEDRVEEIMAGAGELVVCTYPPRDLDRFMSFYNSAKKTGRDLVIDPRQAHLLKLFAGSDEYSRMFPSPTDSHIKVFIPRKSWGLIDKDVEYWTEKQVQSDYKKWEREFLDYDNRVNYRDVHDEQKKFALYCTDFSLQNVVDVRPNAGSSYIRSSTEPFNEEMVLDHERIKRWLVDLGLLTKDEGWEAIHVSGHGTGDQIKKVVDGAHAKTLVPIHTENGDMFDTIHKNVTKVRLNCTLDV